MEDHYLGDGAYCKISDYGELVIYTHNGISKTNSIVLGRYELKALEGFVATNKNKVTS